MNAREAIRYLKKFPPLSRVVLNVNDDEGLVYSDLVPTGFKTERTGLFATLAVDPNNANKQA